MFGRRKQQLIEQVCTPQNLADAWRRVRSNIRVRDRAYSRGPDGVSIEDFEHNLEANLARLGRELRDGTYRPQPVGRFLLRKRGGGTRTISVLAVRDRVAQRAVQNVIEPLFEAQFLDCSYGFRPGRSVANAVARLMAYHQAGYTWILDADIRDCFGSLDHRLLMRFVRSVVREAAVCHLIQDWLAAGVMDVLTDEMIQGKRNVNWDGLMDAAGHHLESALDWGLRRLAGQDDFLPYDADVPLTGSDPALDRDTIRKQALGRLGKEALVLGLTFSRPLVERARRSLPAIRSRVRRRHVAVAALVSLGVALLPFAYKALAGRDGTDGATGTPQGAVLSPLLANAYLHHFDQAMVSRGFALVRYADDWCVVGRSRAEVEQARKVAERVLARLRLSLNEEKTRILPMDDGFVFLGARFGADGIRTSEVEGRGERLRVSVRRVTNQAGKRARQVSQQAARAVRQHGGQLAHSARKTAGKGLARFFRTLAGLTDYQEENNGDTVSDRTGHDPEQN